MRPTVLGTDHRSPILTAGDEAPFQVAGIAVGVTGRLTQHAHAAALLVIFENAIVGDVAEDQKTQIGEPRRPFGPSCAGPKPFKPRIAEHVLVKARIERLYVPRKRRRAAWRLERAFGHPVELIGAARRRTLVPHEFSHAVAQSDECC